MAIRARKGADTPTVVKTLRPQHGSIAAVISTTGTVQPQNRLEIKPSVNGRIEKVLVAEGQYVRAGQVLALMSSSERAALLDAAMSQGPEAVRYWQNAYKPISIMTQISGTVIVKSIEPGQVVTTASAVLVLSDYLIVVADVDETDIGRVSVGQKVTLSLDAYPDIATEGRVKLIHFESTTVNNVTTYKVEVSLDRTPKEFRSGMTANVKIVEKMKSGVLLLPSEAIIIDGQKNYVMLRGAARGETVRREVETGLSDELNTEIVSGLTADDTVCVMSQKAIQEKKKNDSPFMPARRKPR